MTFLEFSQKKPYIKTFKNTVVRHNRPDYRPLKLKSKKTAIHLNSDNFANSYQVSKLSHISSRILIFLKPKNSSLTAGNPMVGQSGTKVINGVASSRIDMFNVCFRNVIVSCKLFLKNISISHINPKMI